MTDIPPFFSHYIGFDEEAHAFFALFAEKIGPPKVPFLLIGTSTGRCLLFSSFSLKQIAVLHEDIGHRQIVAIGRWPFEEETKNDASSAFVCFVWLHFRCHSIALFELFANGCRSPPHFVPLRPLRELSTGHYGFCHALSDPIGGRMFIPDHEDLSSSLRICYRTGGEKLLVLGEEFMSKSFARRTKHAVIDHGMFKGLLMGVELLSQDHLLLAFEDSTVCAFNLPTNQVNDALKHPERPEFLCWAVLPLSSFTDGIAAVDPSPLRALVAVSVVGQLYLLNFCSSGFDTGESDGADGRWTMLRVECKVKKCKRESECTALAFFSDHRHQSPMQRMASGFKDGIIEFRSVVIPSADAIGGRWSTVLLAKCDFNTCAIRTLCFIVGGTAPQDEEGSHDGSSLGRISNGRLPPSQCPPSHCSPSSVPLVLISGASDGKVCLFVLSR